MASSSMLKMGVEPLDEVAQRHEAVAELLNPASAAGWLMCEA